MPNPKPCATKERPIIFRDLCDPETSRVLCPTCNRKIKIVEDAFEEWKAAGDGVK